jgi:hypothetical protein
VTDFGPHGVLRMDTKIIGYGSSPGALFKTYVFGHGGMVIEIEAMHGSFRTSVHISSAEAKSIADTLLRQAALDPNAEPAEPAEVVF